MNDLARPNMRGQKQTIPGKLKAMALLVAWLFLTSSSFAVSIVVPNDCANVEGNEGNYLPFHSEEWTNHMRYQQVYEASQFGVLSQPARITHIAFRPDQWGGDAFASTIQDIQINLSTTSGAPDNLSLTFADNVGVDNTVVYSGSLSLSSSDTGGPPRDFDIIIPLQYPFLYDPGAGNMLLDIRIFTPAGTTGFDAETPEGDSVSRLFSLDVNSPTGDTSDSAGLVTQFTAQPIPEPGTLALLAAGALGLLGYGWRRKRR